MKTNQGFYLISFTLFSSLTILVALSVITLSADTSKMLSNELKSQHDRLHSTTELFSLLTTYKSKSHFNCIAGDSNYQTLCYLNSSRNLLSLINFDKLLEDPEDCPLSGLPSLSANKDRISARSYNSCYFRKTSSNSLRYIENIEFALPLILPSGGVTLMIVSPGYIYLAGGIHADRNVTIIAGGDIIMGSIHSNSAALITLISATGRVQTGVVTGNPTLKISDSKNFDGEALPEELPQLELLIAGFPVRH